MAISFPSITHTHPRVRLRRSSRARKCPICQGDGCGQAEGITLCWRVESDKQANSGAWIHRDETQARPFVWTPPEIPLAPIERRNAVYSGLLELCTLTDPHKTHLESTRHLSSAAIWRAQFRTVPNRMTGDAIATQLAKRWEMKGVPGFWRKDGRWVMSFAGKAGFYIPIRNAVGQIEALQIRCDYGKPKYLLVSSRDLPDGVSSGAPAHFTKLKGETAIITEGALKAEVIAELLQAPVIGLVAVGTFPDSFGQSLKRLCPYLRRVAIAFDADWRTNDKVQMQMKRLSESLKAANFAVEIRTWPAELGKGYDDYLMGGQ